MGQNFFDLVKPLLPSSLRPQEVMSFAPQAWWAERNYLAAAYALRRCPRIDWSAYLESYPDVKESGMDACLHFLQHGVYEGRKLTGCNEFTANLAEDSPLVSIVIINYNNAHLLPKCLGSVTAQTLKDLEIIVVDDGSTDNSRELVLSYAKGDQRIKLLVNEKNSATLITRKRGVEAATGRFLMLLDSDDYLAENACELAVSKISKGYDMVKFGAHIVNSLNAPAAEIEDSDDWCNRGEAREYFNDEILTSIFRDGKMSWHVWSCIYRRDLAQSALSQLPDEYITGPDDLYALLSIARNAKSMLKISDRLYFYNYGPGVSVTIDRDKLLRYAPARVGAILAIEKFARLHSLNIGLENLYQNLCADLLSKFIAISRNYDVTQSFDYLVKSLGFKNIINALFKRFANNLNNIADLLHPLQKLDPIHRVGIFAPKLHYGGMESVIISVCEVLKKLNYQVVLFLEERGERDADYRKFAQTIYVGEYSSDRVRFSNRLQNIMDGIEAANIDTMIYFQPQRIAFLWDLLTLHHFNIPVVIWEASNFAISLTNDQAKNRLLNEKIFSKANAVICQSDMEEIYLRTRGVNAIKLHAPTPIRAYEEKGEPPPRIVVIGRLGAQIKQAGESLKVLAKIVAKAPWITMRLVGDFYTQEQANKFRQKIRKYGLEKHVEITGWTQEAYKFLSNCGVLLSVSAWESMALGISEAQACGLPCVIYDVPIEQSQGNPSVISVPQGDYEAAANEIVALLGDNERWHRLSMIASENAKKYSHEIFADKFAGFLDSFQRMSPLKIYNKSAYDELINYASFYGGRRFEDSF